MSVCVCGGGDVGVERSGVGGGDSAVKILATKPKAYRWKERTNFHNVSSDLHEWHTNVHMHTNK